MRIRSAGKEVSGQTPEVMSSYIRKHSEGPFGGFLRHPISLTMRERRGGFLFRQNFVLTLPGP